jgi:NCAIR mutase (PurE)-related protein
VRRDALTALLQGLASGQHTVDQVADRLVELPYEDIGYALIDHHRSLRTGMPEVVFAEGKTPEQTAGIFTRLVESGVPALATRAGSDTFAAVAELIPGAQYHSVARCITFESAMIPRRGHVGVVCAGTSDLPVAEEAAVTAEVFGARVTRIHDVGVAGLHRLLAKMPVLRSFDAIVVCAGMEGALPSVLGGLVAVPLIAVPTSVGYGSSFGGVTALLSMLNSCSPNVTVVNIDNGFGAAYVATMIARSSSRAVEAESLE